MRTRGKLVNFVVLSFFKFEIETVWHGHVAAIYSDCLSTTTQETLATERLEALIHLSN